MMTGPVLPTNYPLGRHARFFHWWQAASDAAPTCFRKGTNSLFILVAWTIYKHRNAVIFDGARPSPATISDSIEQEAPPWARAAP